MSQCGEDVESLRRKGLLPAGCLILGYCALEQCDRTQRVSEESRWIAKLAPFALKAMSLSKEI
jgi:hypothetical protein